MLFGDIDTLYNSATLVDFNIAYYITRNVTVLCCQVHSLPFIINQKGIQSDYRSNQLQFCCSLMKIYSYYSIVYLCFNIHLFYIFYLGFAGVLTGHPFDTIKVQYVTSTVSVMYSITRDSESKDLVS